MSKIVKNDSQRIAFSVKILSAFMIFFVAMSFLVCESQREEIQENSSLPQIIYKAGEEGNSGNWDITVLDTSETDNVKSGDSAYNKVTTQGKFVVITLQMKNIAGYTSKYNSREFLLRDPHCEAVYNINNVSFHAMAAANGNEKMYKENSSFICVNDEVGAGTTKKTYIIFEVPKETNIDDYILINRNNNGVITGYNLKISCMINGVR